MLSAGLPGIGLSGLLMLLSALLMPVVELVRTARGQGSRARWLLAGRQWLMAVTMVAIYAVVFDLIGHLVTAGASSRGVVGRLAPDRLGSASTLAVSLAVLAILMLLLMVSGRALANSRSGNTQAR
jgi:hypothetical protein